MQDQAKQPRRKANRNKTYNGTGETQTLGPCLQGRRGGEGTSGDDLSRRACERAQNKEKIGVTLKRLFPAAKRAEGLYSGPANKGDAGAAKMGLHPALVSPGWHRHDKARSFLRAYVLNLWEACER